MDSVRPLTAQEQAAFWSAVRSGSSARCLSAVLAASRACPALLAARDEQGACALHWLCFSGASGAQVRAALDAGLAPALDARSALGQTPLMWSLIGGGGNGSSAARARADAGAALDAADSVGATPLILAAQYDRGEALLDLLARGADAAAGDARRCTVGHWAAYRGRADMLRALRARVGWRALVVADGDGCTPLHRAARGGSLACVRFLVDE